MTFSDFYNQLATNMSVWGLFFLIGIGIWVIALRGFDKKKRK